MKILIAEDDPHILEGLAEIFENEGYETIQTRNGAEALERSRTEEPDFLCLDVMMPEVSGYDVCREVRKSRPDIPVIFISAKSEEIDRVVGLELGADDYIPKPFGVREVVARVRAVHRRYMAGREKAQPHSENAPFQMGELEVFPTELRARRGEQGIDLSLRDVRILQVLHGRSGQVVDRHTLFQEAWGVDHIPNSRTLDQHISQLRKKVERDPKNPSLIQTVHGAGYRFDG